MDTSITRPLMRYHGGKFKLAPWILSYLPRHKVYVESYAGAASVLLNKPRSYAEVYNDLDGEICNVFKVLRNPAQARELVRQVNLTPYARDEFDLSYIIADDPIEQARRTLFRFAAGFATASTRKWKTGFRSNVTRSGSTPAGDWRTMPGVLEQIIERLQGVVIENNPAIQVIQKYDTLETLLYCDPPYPFSTRDKRSAGNSYLHEMTDDDHRELASVLRSVKGMVIISGYACDLYDVELYPDWQRVTRATHGDGAADRVEVLWLNPQVWEAQAQIPLFAEMSGAGGVRQLDVRFNS